MKLSDWRAGLERLVRGITHPEEELSRAQKRVAILWNAGRFALHRLRDHKAPQLAAALSFRTIFSFVPLLVLALVVLGYVYGENGFREALGALLEYLGFDSITVAADADPNQSGEAFQASEEIRKFVDRASARAQSVNSGAIAAVGVLVLIYSALSLLIQIETSFNVVAEARRGRRWTRKLTTYWTLVTLGALALVAWVSLGNATTRTLEDLPGWLSWIEVPARFAATVGATWLLLLFAYTRMPTARLALRPAAIGAIVAALVWETLKHLLTTVLGAAFAGQIAVYGSIAIIPVALLWIYVTWLIVLYGLEIAYLLQTTPAALRRVGLTGPIDSESVMLDTGAVAGVARSVARAFEHGRTVTPEAIARRTGLTPKTIRDILESLQDEGVVRTVESDRDDEIAYTLARPAHRIGMDTIARATRPLVCSPGGTSERRAAEDVRLLITEALAHRTLADDADTRQEPAQDDEPADQEG